MAFNPDGSSVAWGDDRNLVTTVDLISRQKNVMKVHSDQVLDLNYSPDGKNLASTGADGKITIAEKSNSFSPIFLSRSPALTSINYTISYSSDGRYIISGNLKGELIVWDASPIGNYELNSISAHTTPITGLSFNPDGTSLASSGTESASLWDLPDGHLIRNLTQGTIEDIHFLQDGKKVLIGAGWDGSGIWDINSGSRDAGSNFIQFSDAYVQSSATSPDGKLVVTSQMFNNANDSDSMPMVTAWDVEKGIKLQEINFTNRGVFDVALSPNGKYMAAGSEDGTVKILDLGSNKSPRVLTGHENWVRSINFSPDGKMLITGSFDNTAIVWDVESGQKIFTLSHHNASINDVAFSPDGTLIALASSDGTASIWDAKTGSLKFTLTPHAGKLNNLSFSPDGKVIALGSEDGGVRFYFLALEDVISLAKLRLPRTLTLDECQNYLHLDACPDTTVKASEISKENTTPQEINISTPESVIPMPKSNIQSAEAGSTPTVGNSEATPLTGTGIQETKGLKSGNGSTAVTLKFVNQTGKLLKLNWMDGDGVEQPFSDLAPRETDQGTFESHAWRIRDQSGKLLFEYVATAASTQTITVNADFTVTVK